MPNGLIYEVKAKTKKKKPMVNICGCISVNGLTFIRILDDKHDARQYIRILRELGCF